MGEGNGIDLGSIYGLLVEVAKTVSRHDTALLSLQDGLQIVQAELTALRTETRSDNAALRAETRSETAALRHTITQYHASVLGHGILISELEERVRRIKSHLDLPSHVSG